MRTNMKQVRENILLRVVPTHLHAGFRHASADFDLTLGFCGVPSTNTIGPLATWAWVVVELLLLVTSVASTLTGGATGPSLRRALNTLDMLTSRCRTLRGFESVRRIPASCSREIESERERDGAAVCVVDDWTLVWE
jgi:hypothetical protein